MPFLALAIMCCSLTHPQAQVPTSEVRGGALGCVPTAEELEVREALRRAKCWDKLGLGPENHLCWFASKQDPNGDRHLRFAQVYKGLPVLGTEVWVDLPRGGVASFPLKQVFPEICLDVVPEITKAEAIAQARPALAALTPPPKAGWEAHLVVVRLRAKEGDALTFYMAYLVREQLAGNADEGGAGCLIDAKTGAILETRPRWTTLPHWGSTMTP